MQRNEVVLRLGILGFEDVNHDYITNFLNISPVKILVKGEKRNPKNPKSPLIKQNCWFMGSTLDKTASFEDQMNELLDIIEAKLTLFKGLCEKYTCELSCAVFIYRDSDDSKPWIHLDSRYNKIIGELNIEFDLDIYII